MKIAENIPLSRYSFYKIGGPASYFCEPKDTEELAKARDFILSRKLPYFVLGCGSNLIIPDAGFSGLVIHTHKLDKLEEDLERDRATLNCGAGLRVIQALRHCMQTGLKGLECIVGVPGSMGGVFFMNAGTNRGEICEVLTEIEAFDFQTGKTRVIPKEKFQYRYRGQSFLGKNEMILRGKMLLEKTDPALVQEEVQKLLEARKKNQPIDKPSCGSVFKNPDPANGVLAWKLIEKAGLRGHRIGNAQISEMHTNYFVNLGGANAADVLALIALAKERVFLQTGIALEEEVRTLTESRIG